MPLREERTNRARQPRPGGSAACAIASGSGVGRPSDVNAVLFIATELTSYLIQVAKAAWTCCRRTAVALGEAPSRPIRSRSARYWHTSARPPPLAPRASSPCRAKFTLKHGAIARPTPTPHATLTPPKTYSPPPPSTPGPRVTRCAARCAWTNRATQTSNQLVQRRRPESASPRPRVPARSSST